MLNVNSDVCKIVERFDYVRLDRLKLRKQPQMRGKKQEEILMDIKTP